MFDVPQEKNPFQMNDFTTEQLMGEGREIERGAL